MSTDVIGANKAILQAYRALRSGDRTSARRWAFIALSLAEDLEDPWLILAAIASPQASVAYIKRALILHPDSPRAIAAMRWAQQRISVRQVPVLAAAQQPLSSEAVIRSSQSRPAHPSRLIFGGLVVLILMLLLAAAVLPGRQPTNSLALAGSTPTFTAVPRQFLLPSLTPTYLPGLSASFSPTAAASPLPSATPTLLPSMTETSTLTLAPSLTSTFTVTSPPPIRTPQPPAQTPVKANIAYTIKRGDTLSKIAAANGISLQSLILANNIPNPSLIKAGQTITIPAGGSSVPVRAAAGSKRIVVVLAEQHLYAYQDGNQVFSFVVSTGRGNGTLRGEFSILDKDPNAWSDPWGFWMPDWLGIYYVGSNLENGIHSLPVLSNGTQIWGDSIGIPVSYGCVVLRPDDAAQLFNWVNIGTPVEIK
jgi:lipoprotein-anchoring transpeptidase ErfK/SrfK